MAKPFPIRQATPSSPLQSLPSAEQMSLLRTDIRTMRAAHGSLRNLHPWARGHFVFRLIDALNKRDAETDA